MLIYIKRKDDYIFERKQLIMLILISGDSEKGNSSLRRILDQRRQLVMQFFNEKGLFPSGNY